MGAKSFLGEFEQMLLLAILQCGDEANGLQVRRALEQSADRSVSKGAFYTTLDRLETKGYLRWHLAPVPEARTNLPQRHFRVTPEGVDELRRSREALLRLWNGLEEVIGG